MKKQYEIEGMSCAVCARKVEKALLTIEGVKSVGVNLLANRASIESESLIDEATIDRTLKEAGYALKSQGGATKTLKNQTLLVSIVLALGVTYLNMGKMFPLIFFDALSEGAGLWVNSIAQLTMTAVILVLHRALLTNGFKALKEKTPNMNSLIFLSVSASFFVGLMVFVNAFITENVTLLNHLYFESAAMIVVVIALGKHFEGKAKIKTRASLEALREKAPRVAYQKIGSELREVAIDRVKVGDLIWVAQGSAVALDGEVLEGEALVDQSFLTGESMPEWVKAGDKVFAGNILSEGAFLMKAEALGKDSRMSQLVKLVEEAMTQKAPIARLADQVAGVFVPVVIALSILTFSGWLFAGATFSQATNFALSLLVISCPCALGLATPAALMVGMGKAGEWGILFKSPEAMETLAKVQKLFFDKTGTLTEGAFSLEAICAFNGQSEAQVLSLAASLEQFSSHPLAKAIVKVAEQQAVPFLTLEKVEERLGLGLIHAFGSIGQVKLMAQQGVQLTPEQREVEKALLQAHSHVLYVEQFGSLIGLIGLDDQARSDAKATIEYFDAAHIPTAMLTGDHRLKAQNLAKALGIDDVRAALSPEDKLKIVKDFQGVSAMVGDGVNDAAALASAEVGVSLQGGTDIAQGSADIVLMQGTLISLARAHYLSKAVFRIIKENLFWAFFYNALAIPLAAGLLYPAFGILLTPSIAATAMMCSSLTVLGNALRLRCLKIPLPQSQTQNHKPQLRNLTMSQRVLTIEGMMCPHCVASVTKALSQIPGVTDVTVTLDKNEARCQAPGMLPDSIFKEVIEKAGFKLIEIVHQA